MSNANIQPKSVSLIGASLVNQFGETTDISYLITKINLRESIHSKFVTGSIVLNDSLNLMRNFRMTGQEHITIEVAMYEGNEKVAKDNRIVRNFRIYKIDKVQRADLITESYKMSICDPRLMTAVKKKKSQVYRGSLSSIVANVLIDELDVTGKELEYFIDSEPKNVQFISPNWKIAELLDFCEKNADNSDNRVAYKNSYFLFSTLTGGFRFMPLHEMIKLDAPVSFTYRDRSGVDSSRLSREETRVGLNNQILRYHKPMHFNTLRGLMNGGYASTLSTYNPLTKVVKTSEFDIKKHFSETLNDHVSGYPMIKTGKEQLYVASTDASHTQSPSTTTLGEDIGLNESKDALTLYDSITPHQYDNKNKINDREVFVSYGHDNDKNNTLQRAAMTEQLQQNFLVVETSARTDVTVGTVVELDIPSAEAPLDDGTLPADEKNDNRYLITDMIFEYTNDVSKLILECVKESYAKPVERVKVTRSNVRGERT